MSIHIVHNAVTSYKTTSLQNENATAYGDKYW